jgi:hypothetical protein
MAVSSWDVISPDSLASTTEVPASIGVFRRPEMATQPRRGVIYALAPSPKDFNVIWAGTDDGLIHVTKDGGKTWKNVTPPGNRRREQDLADRCQPLRRQHCDTSRKPN